MIQHRKLGIEKVYLQLIVTFPGTYITLKQNHINLMQIVGFAETIYQGSYYQIMVYDRFVWRKIGQ